jgi:hypothetical protein
LAKGKANPKLRIAVLAEWCDRPEVRELVEAGHEIVPQDVLTFDLILAPQAHAWGEAMWETPYLKAALTAARKRHRERKKANG